MVAEVVAEVVADAARRRSKGRRVPAHGLILGSPGRTTHRKIAMGSDSFMGLRPQKRAEPKVKATPFLVATLP